MASTNDEYQKQRVLARISKDWLTSMDALQSLGVARLAARINDLKADGYKIERTWHFVKTVHGEKGVARVAAYRLAQENEKPVDAAPNLDALLGGVRVAA